MDMRFVFFLLLVWSQKGQAQSFFQEWILGPVNPLSVQQPLGLANTQAAPPTSFSLFMRHPYGIEEFFTLDVQYAFLLKKSDRLGLQFTALRSKDWILPSFRFQYLRALGKTQIALSLQWYEHRSNSDSSFSLRSLRLAGIRSITDQFIVYLDISQSMDQSLAELRFGLQYKINKHHQCSLFFDFQMNQYTGIYIDWIYHMHPLWTLKTTYQIRAPELEVQLYYKFSKLLLISTALGYHPVLGLSPRVGILLNPN